MVSLYRGTFQLEENKSHICCIWFCLICEVHFCQNFYLNWFEFHTVVIKVLEMNVF